VDRLLDDVHDLLAEPDGVDHDHDVPVVLA
jgi:hypothetical protein